MYLSAFLGPIQAISSHPAVSCDCPCMENVGLYRVELGILGRGVVLKQDVSGSKLFLLQIVESRPPSYLSKKTTVKNKKWKGHI